MSRKHWRLGMLVIAGLVVLCPTAARATVVIDTVFVGNRGASGEGSGPLSGYGAYHLDYNIGKYEVTARQYTEFLNKVAATDTYGLYNPSMDTTVDPYGCNIRRTGSSGNFVYTVGDGSPADQANWGNRPVNFVSWGDAARFANWMYNNQPTGAQNATTTESGSYGLNGAMSSGALLGVWRNPYEIGWAIPDQNQWYKAAYHKNDGNTANYWAYPTASDIVPNNGNPEDDTGNSANYRDWDSAQDDYTIGSPYWRTNVGFFAQSESAYGTFDQGGNVAEWCDPWCHYCGGDFRAAAGGGFSDAYFSLGHYSIAETADPTTESARMGFRLCNRIPEPAMLLLIAVGGLQVIRRRR